MVPKKPKSKRLRLGHKNRITKRIKDSQRKARRETRQNPSKHNKTKKDPGIPNNWPFKEEMLNQIEQERMEAEQEKLRAKQVRQAEKAKAKKAKKALQRVFSKENKEEEEEEDEDVKEDEEDEDVKEDTTTEEKTD